MNLKIKANTLNKVLLMTLVPLFLSSCASQKSVPTTQTPIQKPVEALTPVEIARTADTILEEAKALSANQAIPLLIEASQLYLAEQKPQKALWLLNHTQLLVTDALQQYQCFTLKAQALNVLGQPLAANQQLELANALSVDKKVSPQFDYYTQLAITQTALAHPITALYAQMQAFSLNPKANEQDSFTIWQNLNKLSEWQLKQLAQEKPKYFKGWARLSQYGRQFGTNEAQFHRYLTQWQTQFPTHPAQTVVAKLIEAEPLSPLAVQRIAVLLPLSGSQAKAGQAAQQGMLAAYENDKSKFLFFIDANTLDWTTLQEQLIEQNIDHLVGPLLRKNVNQLLALDTIETPTLLLNLPGATPLKPYQSAISMRPEDEAIQAAANLATKQYKHPILLVHQDNTSKRIAKAFTDEWLRLTGKNIENVPFKQGKDMQNNLKASLDVDKSQQRIKEVDVRIKQTIKYEARNRRDIDMIYVIGSATQTKLLKPYIDVSISPFADPIPVYASSRSHSAKNDISDSRDLTGLTFTEIPWLLKSKQQNKTLFALAKKLFPHRSDSLQSIFAMGYDSINLLDKLSHMKHHDYVRHYGQTGVMKLNKNNIITRSLLWGRYQKKRVQEIAVVQ